MKKPSRIFDKYCLVKKFESLSYHKLLKKVL